MIEIQQTEALATELFLKEDLSGIDMELSYLYGEVQTDLLMDEVSAPQEKVPGYPNDKIHEVKKGDQNLSNVATIISGKTNLSQSIISEITKYLQLSNDMPNDKIFVGNKLGYNKTLIDKIVQGYKVYKVTSNDNKGLTQIAKKIGSTVDHLKKENGLTGDTIHPGRFLIYKLSEGGNTSPVTPPDNIEISKQSENKKRFDNGCKYADVGAEDRTAHETNEKLGNQKIIDAYKNVKNPTIISVEEVHKRNSDNLGEKITTVKKIVLHSTAGIYKDAIAKIKETGVKKGPNGIMAQFLVGQDGKIYQILRGGELKGITHSYRGNRGDMTPGKFKNQSIGIEVEAKTEWNDTQYESVKQLIKWIATNYNKDLKISDILTHSQIDGSKGNRGGKLDPYYVNRTKLGLPNNYTMFDPNVAKGTINANLERINTDRKKIGLEQWQIDRLTSGLKISDKISKEK